MAKVDCLRDIISKLIQMENRKETTPLDRLILHDATYLLKDYEMYLNKDSLIGDKNEKVK